MERSALKPAGGDGAQVGACQRATTTARTPSTPSPAGSLTGQHARGRLPAAAADLRPRPGIQDRIDSDFWVSS
eukprot:10094380-Heterocapsa_arctica.AAC.1